ncbi:MAG: hypothetical protein WCK55_10630 [Verrucomicrobiota bacterium]
MCPPYTTDAPWFDTAVDSVKKKRGSAPVELDGEPLITAITKFFVREFPDVDEDRIKEMLSKKSAGRSPDDLFALRDLPVRELASKFYSNAMVGTQAKEVAERYLRMFDLHFARYENDRLGKHGRERSGPFNALKISHGPQIEEAAQYAGLIHDAACLMELGGIIREEKPWLTDSSRIIKLPEFGENLKGQILCEFMQAAIIDVLSSPLAKRHVFVWPTNSPRRIGKFWEWMLKRHLPWPDNLISLTTERNYRADFRAWLSGQECDRSTGRMKIPLPYWAPFTAVVGGQQMEELLMRPHRISWCIVENSTTNADLTWIERLHTRCGKSDTALFVNGIGRTPVFEGKPVALKDGSAAGWNEWPAPLRIRETPAWFMNTRRTEPEPELVKKIKEGVKRLEWNAFPSSLHGSLTS